MDESSKTPARRREFKKRKPNMKTLSCKDLGISECNFSAKAQTSEEAMKMATDHATHAHKDKIEEMGKAMNPEQMKAMMTSKIKDEA